ncbi:RING finger protein nhl-1-like [Oopsacas minuta]|uniref:RING finger protein nhl-1-like n=1 Tax=Oopsacas minuta TaxID=111878 RepID=A0AAV7JJS6_9METZ|nr:RING finger protein nhl-1-like [Oopsacas minuta]
MAYSEFNPLVCVECQHLKTPINILECFHVICQDCHFKKKGKLFLISCPSCSQITSLPFKECLKNLSVLILKEVLPETSRDSIPSLLKNIAMLSEETNAREFEKCELENQYESLNSSYQLKLEDINAEFDRKLRILEQERDTQILDLEKNNKSKQVAFTKQIDNVNKTLSKTIQRKHFLQICSDRMTESEYRTYKSILDPAQPRPRIASVSIKSLDPDSSSAPIVSKEAQFTQSLPIFNKDSAVSKPKPKPRYNRNFSLCKEPSFSFGRYGIGRMEFRALKAVCVSPDDSCVFVLDQNQVKAFDSKGSDLFQFSSFPVKRSIPLELSSIAADEYNVYVTNTSHDIVYVMTLTYLVATDTQPCGAELKTTIGNTGPFIQRLRLPGSIVYNTFKSLLFIADNGNKRIAVYNAGLNYVCQIGKGNIELAGSLCVSVDGELIYILERGKISTKCVRIFNYTGDLVKEFAMRHSELKHPWCLCVSDEGQVMVSDGSPDYGTLGHSVRVFSRDGKQIGKIGCSGKGMGQFKDPRGLVIDSKGKMIVIDSGNHRLQIF